ncbi:MAG: nicotinate (nicotinamide) nucleotide adenylyltransferase [Clostridia bacterium]|nr:nicotinate (nicotinamide) nucleotide adenylyltransferase [Clostridia bacterium]
MRIGIYGGSFNPVHRGHKHLADTMCAKLNLDKCIIMPAFVSPFKTDKKSSVTAQDRFRMCELAFREANYEVSDLEIAKNETSYTVNTLTALKEQYPDDELFLIIGSDMLLSFNRWYRWQDILKLATLCAVSRCDEDPLQELEDFAESHLRKEGEVLILPFSPLVVSSTLLREKIRIGEDTSAFLHPAVKDYIQQNNLYIEG